MSIDIKIGLFSIRYFSHTKGKAAPIGGTTQNVDETIYLVTYDNGWNIKGWPVKTIVRGITVADNFEVIGKRGYGKMVTRNPKLS